jgi:iron complex outermembrane receptor protein
MRRSTLLFVILCAIVASAAFGAETGRISGRITKADGGGIGGVVVVLNETGDAVLTDTNGSYAFEHVAPGTYSLAFTAGDNGDSETGVEVTAGQTARVNKAVDWSLSVAETITVFAASRKTERIVEAPASVTVISEEQIEMIAASGQLPKLVENAPGVDFSQSGIYDINFNARGFNSSLNRRILTLIDGRDPAIPFLGAQEWAAVSFPMDELSSVELVRGPGSALYGPNAYNGVLNMTTKQPRFSQGGKFTLTAGELGTGRADARFAGALGNDMFYRVLGGYMESEDFTRSRTAATGVEYSKPCTSTQRTNCLPLEAIPLKTDERQIAFGGLRLDKYWSELALTVEGGYATIDGPVFQTGLGRAQVTDVARPWARVNLNHTHWNALAYYDGRDSDDQFLLSSGANTFEDSYNARVEVQGNYGFMDDKLVLIGGGSYTEQSVDTANPQGRQTLMDEAHEEDQQSLFGQFAWDIGTRLKLVGAARWDDSTLHDSQFSPKGSMVFSITPNQTIRATYNEAFQVPNYSEFFLSAPAGVPLNLSAIENALKPIIGNVPLGLGFVPVLAKGNPNLEVEEITSYEIGYSVIAGGKAYVTIDYYQNQLENFVTDLLPGVNPIYPRYAPPAALSPAQSAIVIGALRANLPPSAFAGLTNLPGTGTPAIVLSYANAGQVDTEGVEFAINYYISNRWIIDANYNWFEFEVKEQALGDVLIPNAPGHKYNLGVSYRGDRFSASGHYRWVDDFPWATGIFVGDVPSYGVVNLTADFKVNDMIALGVNASNATGHEHWESFGGDILDSRALGWVSVTW